MRLLSVMMPDYKAAGVGQERLTGCSRRRVMVGGSLFGSIEMRQLAAILLLIAAPTAGWAQTFACGEATAGQLSCQAEVACECRWFHASAMEGTPAGWRWDCGILRPRCSGNSPATHEDYRDALPDALSITDQSVTVDQDNRQIQWIAPEFEF